MNDINLQRKVIIGALAILLLADLAFAYFNARLSAAR
jgi:hypothetical protein